MKLWEILAIQRGRKQDKINQGKLIRWQTFMLMHNGIIDLEKAHINSPKDLIRFVDEMNEDIPEEEKNDLLNMIQAMRCKD